MLYTLVCLVGGFMILCFGVIFFFLYLKEYANKEGMEKGLRIVYNGSHDGATLWRNTHPSYWKYHKTRRGSVLVLPSNPWIEVNPAEASPVTFLLELGHLQIDIAWLTLEGHVYHSMVRAACEDLHMEAVLEFMAWGVATQLGQINKEWLMRLMLRLYGRLYGEVKVRTALMIALSTPLTKHSIVHSTRRVMKALSL